DDDSFTGSADHYPRTSQSDRSILGLPEKWRLLLRSRERGRVDRIRTLVHEVGPVPVAEEEGSTEVAREIVKTGIHEQAFFCYRLLQIGMALDLKRAGQGTAQGSKKDFEVWAEQSRYFRWWRDGGARSDRFDV